MVKRNEPVATEVEDDALFAPGSWDIGPPSALRSSLRPGSAGAVAAPVPMVAPVASGAQSLAAEGAIAAVASAEPRVPLLAVVPATPPAAVELKHAPSAADDLVSAYETDSDSVSGARLVRPRREPRAGVSLEPPRETLSEGHQTTWLRRLPILSFALSTLGIGFLLFGGNPAAAPASTPPPHGSPTTPAPAVVAPAVVAPAVVAAPTTAERAVGRLPVKAAIVELAVYPADAAVGHRGVMQRGGPPYAFEVPVGESLAVEVARPGYVTRKVTLDGSKARLSINLRKLPGAEPGRGQGVDSSPSADR